MRDEHSHIRHLKHRWNLDDAVRDKLEQQAKKAFLEEEANELFTPIENHLIKLGGVLQAANASVEVDPVWEHLEKQKLRRKAKVIFRESAQDLPLDLTIEGVTIFYHDKSYRFTRGIEELIHVISSDVEQFIIAQSQATRS